MSVYIIVWHSCYLRNPQQGYIFTFYGYILGVVVAVVSVDFCGCVYSGKLVGCFLIAVRMLGCFFACLFFDELLRNVVLW